MSFNLPAHRIIREVRTEKVDAPGGANDIVVLDASAEGLGADEFFIVYNYRLQVGADTGLTWLANSQELSGQMPVAANAGTEAHSTAPDQPVLHTAQQANSDLVLQRSAAGARVGGHISFVTARKI